MVTHTVTHHTHVDDHSILGLRDCLVDQVNTAPVALG